MPLLPGHHHQLLLLLLLVAVAGSHGDSTNETYDTSMCLPRDYTCGGVRIGYPFYLAGKTEDLKGYASSYCGYPGLGILCDDGKPILQLNGAANYTVKSTDGANATVTLADDESNTCPRPRIVRNITLQQGSLLYFSDSTVDYLVFFINCTFNSTFYRPSGIDLITCQNSLPGAVGQSFVLPDDAVPSGNWAQACSQVIKLPVHKGPINYGADPGWTTGGYAKFLHQEFQLGWNDSGKPHTCIQCEASKGRCGHSQTRDFIGCLCPDGLVQSGYCDGTGKLFAYEAFSLNMNLLGVSFVVSLGWM